MKAKIKIVGTLVLLGCLPGISHGTTLGFVDAAGGSNGDIPLNYGGNAVVDGPGWTVSDGTGITPDIGLVWAGGANVWEFHSAASFSFVESQTAGGTWDANPNNAVSQLDGDGSGHLEIKFSAAAGVALILNSFDIGNATDLVENPYGFDLTLVRDSDSNTVWSHTTATFGPGDAATVAMNYIGDPGENYTLNFDSTSTSNVTVRTALDNLSFSQDPVSAITVGNGTTTLGFVGAAGGNNGDIPLHYGGNVAADGTGWATSSETAGTPDVILTWLGGANAWEFHSASSFTPLEEKTVGGTWDANLDNAIAQLEGGPHLELNFSVPEGIALVLDSFDIGNATDQSEDPYGFDITLVRDSDSATVWSHSTPLSGGGGVAMITIDYIGDAGESYTLNFDRNPEVGGDGKSITFRTGIDNLRFGQIPAIGNIGIAPSAGGIDLAWNTGSGVSYALLEKTDLQAETWSTNHIAGEEINVTVTVPFTNDTAFFKVVVEQ